jgi:hypothetical protein
MGTPRTRSSTRSSPTTEMVGIIALMVVLAAVVPGSVQAGQGRVTAGSYPDGHAGEVRRLYLAYFDREPDPTGAAYWESRRSSGMSVAAISAYFAQSGEFRARYGNVDDAGFVTLVYRNVLGREPDANGHDYWQQRLAEGMSRGSLMAHFSESREFVHRVHHSSDLTPSSSHDGGHTTHADGGTTSGSTQATTTTTTTTTTTLTAAPAPDAMSPPTTTAPPPPTTISPTSPPPASGGFVERFDHNQGLSRFRTGVFHRDVDAHTAGSMSGSWEGDHNIHLADCGDPHTNSHTIAKNNRPGAFYVCRDHLMTSVGHVDSYSIAWFSPDQTFTGNRTVAWDVNSTWLGSRQWWEVAIIPTGAPDLSCIFWLPCDIPAYPAGAVVVGTRDNGVRVWSNGGERDATWQTICRSNEYSLDPEGCDSKAIRRPWSVTDNANNTLTVRFHTHTWTVPGSFPDGPFRVVFKDHNYTPLKDGPVAGFTWHWDNIVIE